MRRYDEEELLMLSGIQHFAFCPRQWYLIHVEQLWADNHLTAQGQILHQRVNSPEQSERKGSKIILRSVPLTSYQLGLYGISDAVELSPASDHEESFFRHPKYEGKWSAKPIEYKRGRPKRSVIDKVQLCAEAICLEEMYTIDIPYAEIYYGETKHRLEVELTTELRDETFAYASQMHRAFRSKKPIKACSIAKCRSCSLLDLCIPIKSRHSAVKAYLLRNNLFEI